MTPAKSQPKQAEYCARRMALVDKALTANALGCLMIIDMAPPRCILLEINIRS